MKEIENQKPGIQCVIPQLVFQFFLFFIALQQPVRLWFYETQGTGIAAWDIGIDDSNGEELW